MSTLLFISSGLYSQNHNVIIQGDIKNFSNQMSIEDMSEMAPLNLLDNARTFVPDSNGKFLIKFTINKPGYFRLGYNIIYISPNDKMTISMDYQDPSRTIYAGDHQQENEYLLQTPYPHAGSYLNGGQNVKTTIKETADIIFELADHHQKELKHYEHFSEQFKLLERNRIKADMINSLIMLPTYFLSRQKTGRDSASYYRELYSQEILPLLKKNSTNFLNKDLLGLEVYTMILPYLLDLDSTHASSTAVLNDYIKATRLSSKLKSAKSREDLLKYKTAISQLTTPSYKSALSGMLSQLTKFGNGDNAIDLQAMSLEGKLVNLKEFAGKVIYIDLWATWCRPCIDEFPALEKLREKYADRSDIIFLSLSVDDDKPAWKKKLALIKSGGIQWIIDRSKLSPYAVTGYPRIIIIDKNFKVSAMHGTLPSSPATEPYLNELLLSSNQTN